MKAAPQIRSCWRARNEAEAGTEKRGKKAKKPARKLGQLEPSPAPSLVSSPCENPPPQPTSRPPHLLGCSALLAGPAKPSPTRRGAMDTEPFDEAELLDLPASPVVTPPRRLKRLKKSSSQPTTAAINTTEVPLAGSPPPPPSSPPPVASPGEETLAPRLSPPSKSSPPVSDVDALSPLPHSSPNPVSSPMPPTDSPDDDEEDDGFDPLLSESGSAAGWDPLGMPVEGDVGDEEEMLGGGLIEELRRETAVKKRLDMDEGEGEMVAGAEAKRKRSKRKRKEGAPKESAREKKRSEKVSIFSSVLARECVQLNCL
jgi:hypothetical protein